MPYPEYRESAVHIYAPTFTLYDDHLAVVTTLTDGSHSLPNAYVREDHYKQGEALQAAAREALYVAFGEAQPTLEPIITHVENKSDNTDIEIAYAAITRIIDVTSNPALRPIPLPHIEDVALGLTTLELHFIDAGLRKLREYPNLTPGARLQQPKTLSMLSRLVENPRRFTISELRTAYEALLFDSLGSSVQLQPREKVDPHNFHRDITGTLVPLPEYSSGRGRPARFWSMPLMTLESST